MTSWPDVEGAMRDYLRANAALDLIVDGRVFFGLPAKCKFPVVVVRRVTGGQDPGEAPIDRPMLQIDCWGKPGDKFGAYACAAAVRDALGAIRRTTQGSTLLYGASVFGAVFSPDPETDQPRYSLSVDLTARAVPA